MDHADVVCAVPDGERHSADALLDKLDDERLLKWGDTTADDALALHREPQQQVLVLIVCQRLQCVRPCMSDHNAHERTYVCERATIDDQYESTGALAVVVSDERGRSGVDAPERISARLLLLDEALVVPDVFVLEDTALGEEFLDGVHHLQIDRGMAFTATTDNDDVVFAADEVRAVANR